MRNTAVGILSHNRLSYLKLLIESIRKTHDRREIDLFVGEDSTPDDQSGCRDWLRKQSDILYIFNDRAPLGIAGNANVLLGAMRDYDWKFLLNDDLLVIKHGWTRIYTDLMPTARLHHCCLDIPMIVGQNISKVKLNGVDCLKITEKPQGHCMVLDQKAFETVGYFDEKLFPMYGFEHVDWSNRVSLSGIQPPGIWDIMGSRAFFLSQDRRYVTGKRLNQFKENALNWNKVCGKKSRIYIERIVHENSKSENPS